MRPTPIIWIVLGVLVALGGLAVTVLVFVDRNTSEPWHYWIAPFLALSFAFLLLGLGAGYYLRVIRPEVKGRPRSE